ncbi:MAG: bifunctional nuclease family protein [Candidatus Kapabacteria bacterium]|nr:bifunctional nuclease family protein [Candidatus Kapabacteria bacterium]
MEKIQLVVLGLSASPASSNAYALILKEVDGNRRLPIIIGAFEAQAIALEMEGVVPPRPMTHDLIKSIIDSFNITLSEVYINELRDGTFFAKLIFEDSSIEIDARPSDAIALAVRCNTPIFVESQILNETGIIPQGEEQEMDEDDEDDLQFLKKEKPQPKPTSKLEQLQLQLDKAIQDEDYENAARIRDEIKKILGSS